MNYNEQEGGFMKDRKPNKDLEKLYSNLFSIVEILFVFLLFSMLYSLTDEYLDNGSGEIFLNIVHAISIANLVFVLYYTVSSLLKERVEAQRKDQKESLKYLFISCCFYEAGEANVHLWERPQDLLELFLD